MGAVLGRLVLILGLLTFALSAQAATVADLDTRAVTTNASTYASNSFTPAANDLLVVACAVSGTVAAGSMTDSQALGFTQIAKGTWVAGSTMYLYVANTLAAATAMTVTCDVTGDAGTGAVTKVWGIGGISRKKGNAVRQSVVASNQAAGGTPAVTFGAAVLTGSPTLGFVANSTNPAGLTPPTGWTEAAGDDVGYATPTSGGEAISRASGFTGTTITWGSTSASGFGVIALELDTSSSTGTPTLIQHVLGPTAGAGISTYKVQLPNSSLSGNAILCGVSTNSTAPTITVTDNIGNTYTAGPTVTGNQKVQILYALNATAGVTTVTVSLSALTQFVQAGCSEFNNVATVAAADGTCTGSGFANPVACGAAITTTAAGDLVYQVAWQDTGAGLTTSITQGAAPWKLLHADKASTSIGAAMAQYQVQTTAGAITPSLTINDLDHFDTVAIALKPAASGTAMPGGIRVVHLQHSTISGAATSPINTQFPSTGNLLVVVWIGVDQIDLSAVSDGNTNTWAFAGAACGGVSGSGHVRIAYAANATTGTTMTGPNLSFTGTNISGDTALVFDITGAATAPFDSTAGNPCATGTDNITTNPHSVSTVSITPSTANGLIFAAMGVTTNTAVGVSPGLLDSCVASPEATSGDMDENNGWANEYNADTASRTYSFTIRTDNNPAVGAQGWSAMAAAFKAPAAPSAAPSQLPTLGCCGRASLSMGNPAVLGGVSSYGFDFSIAPDLISLASYPGCDAAAGCKAGVRICQAGTTTKCADFFAGDGQADVYLIRKQGTSAMQAFKAGTAQYSAPTAFGVIP